MDTTNSKNIFLGGIFILLSAIVLAIGLNNIKDKTGIVSVKGSASRYVTADKVLWNINFGSAGNDLNIINKKILEDTEKVKTFLKKFQLTDEEINLGQLDFIDMDSREYKDPNQKNRFIVTQNIFVESNNVNAVEKASKNLIDLIQQNVYLKDSYGSNSMKPIYLFTKLDDIKNKMIDEATEKAKNSAEQFAKNSGTKVRKIKNANQGVFVITGRNKATQYGNEELNQKEKEIRVVSTIEYYLK